MADVEAYLHRQRSSWFAMDLADPDADGLDLSLRVPSVRAIGTTAHTTMYAIIVSVVEI